MHRGQLLANLRKSRGLTQNQLADLAGVSRTRLAQAESDPEVVLRRTTVEFICAALEKTRPFTPQEREAFLSAFNLGAIWRVAQSALAAAAPVASPPAHDDTYARIERLRSRYGSLMLSKVLDAIEILLPVAAIAAEEDPTVRVVSPPVQREGYTEQVITEYGSPTRKPPAKSAREKRAREKRA